MYNLLIDFQDDNLVVFTHNFEKYIYLFLFFSTNASIIDDFFLGIFAFAF